MRIILAVITMALVCACKPANSPVDVKNEIRASLITLAYAYNRADDSCVEVAHDLGPVAGMSFARKCDTALRSIEALLVTAEASLDTWKDADESRLACAVKDASTAMLGVTDMAAQLGHPMPDSIEGAVKVAGLASVFCVGAK